MKTVKDKLKVLTVRKILLNDLESHGVWSILWKDYKKIKVIARRSDIKITSVNSKTPKTIQILHPDSYQPIDIDINKETSDLKIGNEVKVLEIEGKLYILKKQS